MSNQLHELHVREVVRETAEAVTVIFDVPQDLESTFARKAGQYLTLETTINTETVRRAYSISTAIHDPHLAVTVKQLRGGKMSTYINEHLQAGHTLMVLPPEGTFTVVPDHDLRQHHVFVAAGSGITPVMSMIRTILEEEPMSTCHLLYGNRNENTIIFKTTLDALEQKYAGQLSVVHILSKPVLHRQAGISGLFKAPLPSWKGPVGRIDADLLENYLKEKTINRQQAQYYICGPGALIATVEEHLKGSIENKKHIHVEYFSAPIGQETAGEEGGAGAVEVLLKGQTIRIDVPASKSILDVLIDKGVDPPYSCSSGACSTCMAKVKTGKVMMDACFALDDDEIAEGYILTCQAHPITPQVSISFDE